jgi:hypothetical protein
MSDSLIETIKKDIKEIVETEIHKFIEHYKDCKQVDAIYKYWDFKVVKFDVVVHELPCDVSQGYVVKGKVYDEISNIICYVEYEDKNDTITIAYVEIAKFYDKCFIKTYIDNERIEETARKIIEVTNTS